jgi:hypothetical protein
MAQPATDSNVLTTLDDRVPTSFYWQLTLLATLGEFLFGYDTSKIGSALNFVPTGCTARPWATWSPGRPSARLAIVFVWKFLPETG